MTDMTLTKTRLFAGVWEGELTGAGKGKPQLKVSHQGNVMDGLTVTHDGEQDVWRVSVPIQPHLISDGVQTFVICDDKDNVLNSFTLLLGEALAEDIRAEMSLLRSELDMLKQSFRRHCNEN